MSITTTTRSAGPFAGDGVTVALPFSFKVFAGSDLRVERTSAAGITTTLALSTHYTVALNADQDTAPGGVATLLTPLAIGESALITSAVPATQPLQLRNGGPFLPRSVEDALDRQMVVLQQLGGALERSVRGPHLDVLDQLPPAAERAEKVLSFNSSGQPVATTPVAGTATALAVALSSSGGADMIGRGAGTLEDALTLGYGSAVYPEQFGAKGDWNGTTGTDDTAALNAAFAAVAVTSWGGSQAAGWAKGGGCVVLTPGKRYRITDELLIGSSTTLIGNGAGGSTAKFLTTNTGASIVCDFPGDKKKWALNSATFETGASGTTAGARPALNRVYTGDENNAGATTLTQGIQIIGVHIDGRGAWGGIRLQGTSGFTVRDCLVVNTGCGYLFNTCFGGAYSKIMALYDAYGMVVAHSTALESGHAYMDRQYSGWTIDSSTRMLRAGIGDPGNGLPDWSNQQIGMYFYASLQLTMHAHVSEHAKVGAVFDFCNVFDFNGYFEQNERTNAAFLASTGKHISFSNTTTDGPRYHVGTGCDLVFDKCTRGQIVVGNSTSKILVRGEDTIISDADWTWHDTISFEDLGGFSVSAAGTTSGVYGAITLQEAMRRISNSARRDWVVTITDGNTVATTANLTLQDKDIVFRQSGGGALPTISVGSSGAGAGVYRWSFGGCCSLAFKGVNVTFPTVAPLAGDKGLIATAGASSVRLSFTGGTVQLGNGYSLLQAFNGLPMRLDAVFSGVTITASTAAGKILQDTGTALVTCISAGCTVDAGIKALGTNGWGGTVLSSNF